VHPQFHHLEEVHHSDQATSKLNGAAAAQPRGDEVLFTQATAMVKEAHQQLTRVYDTWQQANAAFKTAATRYNQWKVFKVKTEPAWRGTHQDQRIKVHDCEELYTLQSVKADMEKKRRLYAAQWAKYSYLLGCLGT
jgi:hypothetical protein